MQIRTILARVGAVALLLTSSAYAATEGKEVFTATEGSGLYVKSIAAVDDLTLQVTFSEALGADAVTLKLTQDSDKSDVSVKKTTLDTTKTIVTAKLATPLFISEKYTLLVTAAKSAAGNSLAQTTAGQGFTTPDDLAFGEEEDTPTAVQTVDNGSSAIPTGTVTATGAEATTSTTTYSADGTTGLNTAGDVKATSELNSAGAEDTMSGNLGSSVTPTPAATVVEANSGALVSDATKLPKTGPEEALLLILAILAAPAVVYVISKKQAA